MTADEHQQVIDELQVVIDDTQHTIERFEATGMDEQMPEDYEKLLDILDAVLYSTQLRTKSINFVQSFIQKLQGLISLQDCVALCDQVLT